MLQGALLLLSTPLCDAIANFNAFIHFQEHAKDIVRERGLPKITVDDLVKEITPKGRRKFF